jgi:hypothetical protein
VARQISFGPSLSLGEGDARAEKGLVNNFRTVRAEEFLVMDPTAISPLGTWGSNWIWGLPLIVATVAFHAFGLGLLGERGSIFLKRWDRSSVPRKFSGMIMGGAALCAAILHGLEALVWAATYLVLGAIPDRRSAVLYSLGAMTTYGHTSIYLELRWQLMGVLEALDGWILFGLTTAFLFAQMQRILNKPPT